MLNEVSKIGNYSLCMIHNKIKIQLFYKGNLVHMLNPRSCFACCDTLALADKEITPLLAEYHKARVLELRQ
jgi:hypothetical protein